MTKSKQLIGDVNNSYALFVDLMSTLRESNLIQESKNNKVLMFDIMMGIGQFTASVLQLMKMSMPDENEKIDLLNFYKDNFLDVVYEESPISHLSEIEEMIDELKGN
jgi:hypothetical protein